ncbi:hypothetical protein PTI98_010443 [Pleurotus ostreatus]|nr:hypothetical protein PTI98_010443 [Pleurotus ostreatus]
MYCPFDKAIRKNTSVVHSKEAGAQTPISAMIIKVESTGAPSIHPPLMASRRHVFNEAIPTMSASRLILSCGVPGNDRTFYTEQGIPKYDPQCPLSAIASVPR